MGYAGGRQSSVAEAFTLRPLPYPVLFILFVVFIFLGTSWYFSFEETVEDAEQGFNWVLMATPILLLIAVRWLSSVEGSDRLLRSSSTAARRLWSSSEGSSPWPLAALIVLLLVLVSYQSTFRDMWLI